MKILVITTGGTIGSTTIDGVIDVSADAKLKVIEKYREMSGVNSDDIDFEVVSVLNILSENITHSDYLTLIDIIRSYDFESYSGVIMTHGSDTLAYTASLMSLIWDRDIPLVLVAAHRPVDNEYSNAVANFECAVELIRSKANSVLVPYRNADKVTYIHYADRLLESEMFSDDFVSLSEPYGVYDGTKIKVICSNHERLVLSTLKPALNRVLQIQPYPLLDYSRIDISGVDAVLHRVYHAGTACSGGDSEHSVLEFIRRCNECGVPFYVCGVSSDKKSYQSLAQMVEAGAQIMYDTTPALAYMKLLLTKG